MVLPRLPLTAALAGRLEIVETTGSTNADLRMQAADAVGHPHLSVLVTDDQTAGRGRLDRAWTAPAGAALAVSVLLRRLPPMADRGWIPLLAGVAMADAVAAQLPGHEVGVKWPNDVLVDGRKICGILAEATAEAIVVGAGVNTAMTAVQLPVPTATSFAVLGAEADADRLLADFVGRLDALLRELTETGADGIRSTVAARCLSLGRDVRITLPDGGVLDARATGLAADGALEVAADGSTRRVSAGDVTHAGLV